MLPIWATSAALCLHRDQHGNLTEDASSESEAEDNFTDPSGPGSGFITTEGCTYAYATSFGVVFFHESHIYKQVSTEASSHVQDRLTGATVTAECSDGSNVD